MENFSSFDNLDEVAWGKNVLRNHEAVYFKSIYINSFDVVSSLAAFDGFVTTLFDVRQGTIDRRDFNQSTTALTKIKRPVRNE